MFLLVFVYERHAQGFKQFVAFFVSICIGYERDVHTIDFLNFVDRDLREDDLLFHTQGVISAAIKTFVADTFEITHTWQRNVYQTIQEFVHLVTAQGYLHTNRLIISQLEVRDVFLRASSYSFLT